MKKLSKMTNEELKKLFEANKDFQNRVYDEAYRTAIFCQENEAKEMGTGVFKYHDHYTSFYLTTPEVYGAKTPEKVAGELNKDYMTPENKELYDKLCKLNDEWENMDYDEQDENSELYQSMIETCDKLAEGITDQLRSYEDVDEESALEELYNMADMGYLDNFEADGNIIYENITKVNVLK